MGQKSDPGPAHPYSAHIVAGLRLGPAGIARPEQAVAAVLAMAEHWPEPATVEVAMEPVVAAVGQAAGQVVAVAVAVAAEPNQLAAAVAAVPEQVAAVGPIAAASLRQAVLEEEPLVRPGCHRRQFVRLSAC